MVKDAVVFLAFIKIFKRQRQMVGVGYTLCKRAHPFEKKELLHDQQSSTANVRIVVTCIP